MLIRHEEWSWQRPKNMPYSVVSARTYVGCDPKMIALPPLWRRWRDLIRGASLIDKMSAVTTKAGFGLKSVHLGKFGVGNGVTLAQILAESLMDMHTWPERDGSAVIWLDYCCVTSEDGGREERWWEGVEKILRPRECVMRPTLYLPI